MKYLERPMRILLILCVAGFTSIAAFGQQPYRRTYNQTRQLVRRIDNRSRVFRNNLSRALDRSSLNGSAQEDQINSAAVNLEQSATNLSNSFDSRKSTQAEVQELLTRAQPIDLFMRNHKLAYPAENNWRMLRADLNQLATNYYVAWRWDNPMPLPTPIRIPDWQLTGTYRLDLGMSDDTRTVADRAVSNGNFGKDQNTLYVHLVERLEPPQMLAFDKTGNQIELASSRSPKVTLDANGREYLQRYPDGKMSHVRATLSGNKLTVVSNGNMPNDFTATFEPLDNGQRMLVTREMYAERLNRPVRIRSYYDRTSAVAQFNIFTGPAWGDQALGRFIVPDGTKIVASLDNNLSTKTAVDGDPFTMTVRDPMGYRNATLEGHITNVDRSGRFAGRASMSLNFDRIRLRNGQTYAFAGIVQTLQANNGEDIRVDNEGAVAEQDSQSKTTLERSAIGGAVGALIGAIAGGGKGAAIGAAIGAGAGAGSVYVQGQDDLDLSRGSRVTIRASAPRY